MLTVAIKHFENDECDRALDQLNQAIGSWENLILDGIEFFNNKRSLY